MDFFGNDNVGFEPTPGAINNPENPIQSSQVMLSEGLESIIGYYVVCEFLIGTQLLESRAGILYQVGTNFIVLHQPDLERYIVCDFYAIKFITVYNTRQIPTRRNERSR